MQNIALVFLGLGIFFIVIAGLGLVRMSTLLMRMQAVSKASALGIVLMIVGLILSVANVEVVIKSVIICSFLLLTTPIATHAIALAAKINGE